MRPSPALQLGLLGQFARFVQRKGKRLAGTDLAGNKYFESPPEQPGAVRPRRVMEPLDVDGHASDLTARKGRIPVQWAAWLAFTRQAPPTLEELQADATRQTVLAERVRVLEAADRVVRAKEIEKREGELRLAGASGRGPGDERGVVSDPPKGSLPLPGTASTGSSPAHRSTSPLSRALRSPSLQPKLKADPGSSSNPSNADADAKSGAGAPGGEGPPLPARPGAHEWKPEGWAPRVAQRGGGGRGSGGD